MLEESFADGPTFVEFSDQVVFVGDSVIKKSLAKWRVSANQTNGLYCNAGLVHRQENETDAIVFRDVRICSHKTEHPVGPLST